MGNRAVLHRIRVQLALALFLRLLNRVRHLTRLGVADADTTLTVADDHEGRKAKPSAALDGCRCSVDADRGRLEGSIIVECFSHLMLPHG